MSVQDSAYHHPIAFWAGTAAVASGVVFHFPMFFTSASMGYRMAGMPMTQLMLAGMFLIVSGLGLASYGLIPFGRLRSSDAGVASGVHFRAMDGARLTGAHWGLLFVLGVALVVDVMKPATLGFVVPGMQLEYGLTTNRVALFPLVALTGTTIGSVLWGVLADRIGRRAAILLASVMFMATSICGFMPSFGWNLFMCLIMGMSAGGMLPIVYALMAESIPAKKRGWLVVLHGGLGSVGGYLVAAGLATYFEPIFTWRILWLAGLPTGLLVLVLNRWIPESPRFLLAHGRVDEAERLMRRYGIDMRRAEGDSPTEDVRAAAPQPGISSLLRAPYLQHTVTVMSYGLGWGLVNWGFLTFMPTMLRARGLGAADANRMLFLSALIAVPSTLLVAYLYGVWSTKKTMILFALLTALTLIGFSAIDALGDESGRVWLVPLTVLLLVGSGGVISMLSPYTAEVYPTRLRGTGSGLAAGSSKIGGIIAPPLVALVIGAVPGFSLLGLVIAAPVAASALILALTGVETRQRALEEVTHSASPAAGGAGYD